VVRRIPYLFLVTRPQLALAAAKPLRRLQRGTTGLGTRRSRVSEYRFPTAPFGLGPGFTDAPMNEGGAERLYVTHVSRPVANVGVAVTSYAPSAALVHPWFLGSQDENDVQGYAGTPVNVNSYMLDYGTDLGTAGAVFPRQKRFYVAVDSGSDPFTHKQHRGSYVLRSWVNDVRPPRIRLLTHRVADGRPLVVARATDRGSGVEPYSVLIGYRDVLVSAAAFDPESGLAVFALPFEAPALHRGPNRVVLVASDNQEAKNVATPGDAVMPNTGYSVSALTRVRGPVVNWLVPRARACARRPIRLLLLADSTKRIRSVRLFDGERRFRTLRRGAAGLYATTWRPKHRGKHVLRAVAEDAAGRTADAERTIRVCR
jgi:hypothetical protein